MRGSHGNANVAGNSKNKTLRREREMATLRQRVEFDRRVLKIFNGRGYRLRGSVAFAFNALSLSLSGSASIDPLESIIVVDTPLVRNLVPLVEGMPSLDLVRRCCSSLLPGS
jgi:hypothetical protein